MAKPTSWSGSREEFRRWLSGQKATFKEGEKQIHKECRKRPSDKGLERRQTRDEKTCLSGAKKIKFFEEKNLHIIAHHSAYHYTPLHTITHRNIVLQTVTL